MESVEGLEEAAEETIEEVTETAEEATEAAEEDLEESEEVAEEVMEETVEEAAEETAETVEKAAAGAIPLAGFFGRIKSLFRKPEQQEEDLFSNEDALEAASEGIPEDVEESADTIEDHLKTKFKDFDITKKVVLSIGGEEEPPVDSQQEETQEETAEGETDAVPTGGVFAAGFFGKMKDKLQKVVHPGESGFLCMSVL